MKGLSRDELLQDFLQTAEGRYSNSLLDDIPIDAWAETITLPAGRFQFEGHEYQRGIMTEGAPRQVLKKGSQLGLSETQIFKTLYGLLKGFYSQGALYLFPTEKDVYDFSRARFNPLMIENEEISKEVRDTESVSLKRVRKSMLYLRGARATSKIGGMKSMSTQLLSIPVDRVVFDERDNMSDDMIELALTRLGHSKVREEVYLGTPSLPDYGVSKLYDDSDQRVWEITCKHCGAGTVLELEFPGCLVETRSDVIRGCKKCRKEIFTRDGQWVAQHPERSKDLAGFWISRLNSQFIDLRKTLKDFQDPATKNKPELYNSVLALAYVPAENRLRPTAVYECRGQDLMSLSHSGPCCMGVDVGRELHVTIGFRPSPKRIQLCYMARVSDFNDLNSLMRAFNVRCCVIDMEPELRKAREFAESQGGRVFLCDYQESINSGPAWDEKHQTVKVNRTETCDATHDLITSNMLVLPRSGGEMELFVRELCNMAKVLEEDAFTGSRVYRYRKLGDDHYRHSLNYLWIASQRISVFETEADRLTRMLIEKQQDSYDPLTYGLNVSRY